jgi:hypothetical protein
MATASRSVDRGRARIDGARWSLLELEPDPEGNLPGQRDLVIGKTVDVELFEGCRNGRLFDSQCFSRSGERDPGLIVGASDEAFVKAIAAPRHLQRESDPPRV